MSNRVASLLSPPERDPEVLEVGGADEGLHPAEVAARTMAEDHEVGALCTRLSKRFVEKSQILASWFLRSCIGQT